MPQALEQIQGKYEILAKLSEGGMGAVYKVRHRLLAHERVIKVIRSQLEGDQDFRSRFQREARLAVPLVHPNITQLFDFSIDTEGIAFMVFEHVDGVTLLDIQRHVGPPPMALTLEIARQALAGLGYLHREGLIHRDVSPDNLMLSRDRDKGSGGGARVKLLDLGIAKRVGGKTESQLTQAGSFLGKIRYAAPEQFHTGDSRTLDPRADLYAFGIVLYELLTGRYPILGDDPPSILAGHLYHPPLPFDETDPEGRVEATIRTAVLRALAKNPDARFADADAFARALDEGRPRTVPDVTLVEDVITQTRRQLGNKPPAAPGSTQERLDDHFGLTPTPNRQALSEMPTAAAERFDDTAPMPAAMSHAGSPTPPSLADSSPASATLVTTATRHRSTERLEKPDTVQREPTPTVAEGRRWSALVVVLFVLAAAAIGIMAWRQGALRTSAGQEPTTARQATLPSPPTAPPIREDDSSATAAPATDNATADGERGEAATATGSREATTEPTANHVAPSLPPETRPSTRATADPARPEAIPSARPRPPDPPPASAAEPRETAPVPAQTEDTGTPTSSALAPTTLERLPTDDTPPRTPSQRPGGSASFRPAQRQHAPQPAYPAEARTAGVEGLVRIEASIDAEGEVTSVRVLEGLSPALDQAAIDAMQGWRFSPATRYGQPIPDLYRVGFRFELPDDPTAPLPVGGDVRPPVKRDAPLPRVTAEAVEARVHGVVMVQATIDQTGRVLDVGLLRGLGHGLDESTLETVRTWTFEPATRNGEPVKVNHTLTLRFDLREGGAGPSHE